MVSHCIFCKIIAKTLPAAIVQETDSLIVINDIQPQAPIHHLIIPKKHIETILQFQPADMHLSEDIFRMSQTLAKHHTITSFRLVNNNGQQAGQSVFHLHFHFLAGKTLSF